MIFGLLLALAANNTSALTVNLNQLIPNNTLVSVALVRSAPREMGFSLNPSVTRISVTTSPGSTTVPTTQVAASAPVATGTSGIVSFSQLPAVWQCIAHYESNDNLVAVNPVSGDEGAFQFQPSTWAAYAPASYPSNPLEANLNQQYSVALVVLANQGWTAWQTAVLCGE